MMSLYPDINPPEPTRNPSEDTATPCPGCHATEVIDCQCDGTDDYSGGPSKRSLHMMLGFIAKDLAIDISDTANAVTIARRIREQIAALLASDTWGTSENDPEDDPQEWGTEAHSDAMERKAEERRNLGGWQKECAE